MRLSERARAAPPFYVMEIAKEAARIAAEVAHTTRPMLFLNIGEPDFTAPAAVQQAARDAIDRGQTQYTPATGLPRLREAISHWYSQRFGLRVDAARIIVTSGASAALQLACLALVDAGDEILMPDPCYPCNRQFVHAAGGASRLLPAPAAQRFQLDARQVAQAWGPRTRGVMLASPSNPTGTSIAAPELAAIHAEVRRRDGYILADEIYLGLSHDEAYGQSALALGDEGIVSINSFSKYFCMTGWRLGWLVVPPALAGAVERLAQHLFICPNAIAQHAALACFEPESIAEYERRRLEFRRRRDAFIPELDRLGLTVPVMPDGAFYAYADSTQAARKLGVSGSWELAFALMRQAHVVVTPGRDFGQAEPERFIRFSTASSMAQLQEAARRLQEILA
ncbi:MAG: pyridoxal phosphate-dependent aminotransferase [Comamonas sp.]